MIPDSTNLTRIFFCHILRMLRSTKLNVTKSEVLQVVIRYNVY